MQIGFVKSAVILGLMALIGPFSIDMYLPALPAIAENLGTTTSATQMTLMAYFAAFSVSQIVYGPVSDRYGRRLPLLIGLGIFAVGSIGCMFAPSIGTLIAFRFIQGLGGAAVMVIPRAIIRDLHTGTEATRLMALVMLVISISPMLAPLAGSALIVPFGWRAVFAAVLVTAAAATLLVLFVLPETRPVALRTPISAPALASSFGRLLKDPVFMGLTFIGGFGMASFFVYLATASFLYIEQYGLTPTQFSFAFAFNAVGFFIMSQFAARLGERYGLVPMVQAATAGFAASAFVLVLGNLAGLDGFWFLAVMLFIAYAFLGLVVPTVMVLALEENGPVAGLASSLGGTLQMFTGALSIAVVSVVFDGTARPLVLAVGVCAAAALVLSQLTLRSIRTSPVAQ
jgi:DHA1 family bicyclomycin/chloramphenicol resistance-like MFS transporter